MDAMHISMIDATLDKTSFMEYIVQKEGNITINVAKLRAVMKRADAESNVTLRTIDAKLQVSTGDRVFNLSTYENYPESPIPKLSLKTHTRVNTKTFIEALDDSALAESDRVSVIVRSDDVRVRAVGDDVDAEIHLKKGALDTYAEGEVKSSFSFDYLPKIVKAAQPLADDFLLELDENMPIRITFKPTAQAVLVFYLAPYIEG